MLEKEIKEDFPKNIATTKKKYNKMKAANKKNSRNKTSGLATENAIDLQADKFQSIPIQKIDLNTATEQELFALPGVGVALAKRAVEMREQTGGFISVQDFCGRLGLMPHFAVQIENLAFAEYKQKQTPPANNSGRVIDI